MTKVDPKKWSELDFLINNFYEIVEFKRGRGIYGDRVILQRPKSASAIFGERDRLYEFYYMDAKAVVEMPRTIAERIKVITRLVRTGEDVSVLCDYQGEADGNPIDWATQNMQCIRELNTVDYGKLNDMLLERYRLLTPDFLLKLHRHRQRQYYLACSDHYNLITREYADQQLARI